jgi:hypothetical protein
MARRPETSSSSSDHDDGTKSRVEAIDTQFPNGERFIAIVNQSPVYAKRVNGADTLKAAMPRAR